MAVESLRTSKDEDNRNRFFIYFAVTSVTTLAFVIGGGYGWSSPAVPKLQDAEKTPLVHPATTAEVSWITSLFSLGALISSVPSGFLADKIGRKSILLVSALPAIGSNLLMIFGDTVLEFCIARLFLGFTLGMFIGCGVIYTVEVAENHNRGALSFLSLIMVCLGGIFQSTVGPYLTLRDNSIISMIPIGLFLITFGFFVPESPYYYILTDQKDKALKSLQKLRGHEKVEKELLEIIEIIDKSKELQKNNLKSLFTVRINLKCLIICVVLMSLIQFAGTTAITAYTQTIFDQTGSALSSEVSVMIVSITQFFTSAIMYFFIDKVNRKTMMMLSFLGMGVCLVLLDTIIFMNNLNYNTTPYNWVPVFALVMYNVSFLAGLGPLCTIVPGEILDPHVKAVGTTIASCFNVFWGFIIATYFSQAVDAFGLEQVFLVLTVFAFVGIGFIWKCIPETRGKSLMDIQDMLKS